MEHDGATVLLFVGLLTVTGLGAGLVASHFGLPRVVAYVLAGVLFSRDLLGGALGLAIGDGADALMNVSLGLIAYLIGGSITFAQIRRMGKVILSSALGAGLVAFLCVFLAVLLLAPVIAGIPPLHAALALGALAASTAPAGTIAVIHQFRARGPMTTTLLGVVAVDDALGVMLFAFVVATTVGGTLGGALGGAALAILGAVALGVAAGKGLAAIGLHLSRAALRLPLTLGAVLLVVGLAGVLDLSPLLAAMATGFFARLFSRAAADRLFQPIELLEEAVFIIFFTVAGAHFEVAVFLNHVPLIATYVTARIVGKILGAALGARLGGGSRVVVRWLGVGLTSQAGVAIGLALTLARTPAFAAGGQAIVNVILGSTVIFEIVGPLATRVALGRAGELGTRRGAEA